MLKSKCSLCGAEVEVKPEHKQYGIKRQACKKRIAARLAGKRNVHNIDSYK